MIALRDALLDFIAELRAADVRISVAETLDAMNAVATAGLLRIRMREALAAALIKEEADRVVFDEVFTWRFGGGARAAHDPRQSRGDYDGVEGTSGGPSTTVIPLTDRDRPYDDDSPPGATPAHKPSQTNRDPPRRPEPEDPHVSEKASDGENIAPDDGSLEREASQEAGGTALAPHHPDSSSAGESDGDDSSDALEEFAGGDRASQAEAESSGIEAGRAASLRAIERLPFASYSELEFETARDSLAALKRRFRVRVSRRLRLARAGRIDFRRTIRASLQHGGALGDLRFRARRPRHVDLLILADISGSMKYASTLMLEIAAGAHACFHRVRSFVYIDRLAEADFERGHLAMTPPLDLFARSDFGRVLSELWDRRAALVTRATVIVIMGDGRNNRRPARADLLRDLGRLSRAVLWLMPEPQARWNTGDSAIRQYARAVTALIPCENLRELERGLARVS